jgi:ABC-type sugar transport system substrate-binding protein
MKRLRIIVSLPNQNHYQRAQAKAAQLKAGELGAEVQVLDANNDAVNQSQQLLAVLQSSSVPLPDAIVVEPLTSTGLGKVAEAALDARVAWVLLNSQADYIEQFRAKGKAAVFAVTRDHTEIGRIQGRQFAALLPHGGTVLYIKGPNTSAAAVQRTLGAESVNPGNINLRSLRSQWTEVSAREAVAAWLRLSTSRPGSIQLVGCQYDGIARGAQRAFQEIPSTEDRGRWLSLPFTGVDGLLDEGQKWVNHGELTATVVAPITTEVAVETLVQALRTGTQPPAVTFLDLKSYPSLETLTEQGRKRASVVPVP